MTTIAYKDGIIAYDSRMTEGDLIVTDDFDKHLVREGVDFFFSGTVDDYEKGIEAYLSGEHLGANVRAFVVDTGRVYTLFSNKDDMEILELTYPYAIGSGDYFALAAMDMGADAELAVGQAMKRCPFTGGRVNTFEVGNVNL